MQPLEKSSPEAKGKLNSADRNAFIERIKVNPRTDISTKHKGDGNAFGNSADDNPEKGQRIRERERDMER